jgi:hypothetical protein
MPCTLVHDGTAGPLPTPFVNHPEESHTFALRETRNNVLANIGSLLIATDAAADPLGFHLALLALPPSGSQEAETRTHSSSPKSDASCLSSTTPYAGR